MSSAIWLSIVERTGAKGMLLGSNEAPMEAFRAEQALEVLGRVPCAHGSYAAAARMETGVGDADDGS